MNLIKALPIALALTLTSPALAAKAFEDAWTFFGRRDTGAAMTTAEYDTALHALARQFDAICGDSFCEGDFSNLASLGIDCSVNAATKAVGECVWTLAGSYAEIDGESGRVVITKKVFECPLGFKGTATDLVGFLRAATRPDIAGAPGLVGLTVPGAGRDLMAVLQDCL